MRYHQPVKVIPDDLGQVFQHTDIPIVWQYLESTFKISHVWRERYSQELLTQPKSTDDLEFFFTFLKKNIEPALFHLTLKENIVFNMTRYLMKDRIQKIKEEAEGQRRMYRGK